MKKLLVGMTAVASLALAGHALAATGGGATIHNAATLSFNGGLVTDSVNVSVRTVGTAPQFVNSAIDVNAGDNVTVTYEVISQSNGYDTYTMDIDLVASNVSGATNVNYPGSIDLAASITSRPSVGNAVVIPAGSEVGFAAGQTIELSYGGNSYRYTIDSVYVGTPAYTTGNNTTPEDPSRLALTPIGSAPAINGTNPPVGTQIGQVGNFDLTFTAGTPTDAPNPGDYEIEIDVTPSQPDGGGNTTTTTENGGGTVTVLSGEASLVKEVRNETDGGSFGAGATAKSGDVLEYRLTITTVGGNDVTGAVLKDSIPEHVTYVANSTTISVNGAAATPVADVSGTTPLASPAGLEVNSSGTPGEILDGDTVEVIFQVTVK